MQSVKKRTENWLRRTGQNYSSIIKRIKIHSDFVKNMNCIFQQVQSFYYIFQFVSEVKWACAINIGDDVLVEDLWLKHKYYCRELNACQNRVYYGKLPVFCDRLTISNHAVFAIFYKCCETKSYQMSILN